MRSLNLKHSNRFFFSFTNCAELCQLTRRTWTVAVFTCRIYTFLFFCISTLYTRRHWLKKKVSTNTVHYDELGETFSAMLCSLCTTQPWDLDAEWLSRAERGAKFLVDYYIFLQHRSNTGPDIWCRMTVLLPTRTEKKSALVKTLGKKKSTSNIDGKYMRDAWACMNLSWHGGGYLVNIHIPSNHCTNSTRI